MNDLQETIHDKTKWNISNHIIYSKCPKLPKIVTGKILINRQCNVKTKIAQCQNINTCNKQNQKNNAKYKNFYTKFLISTYVVCEFLPFNW